MNIWGLSIRFVITFVIRIREPDQPEADLFMRGNRNELPTDNAYVIKSDKNVSVANGNGNQVFAGQRQG